MIAADLINSTLPTLKPSDKVSQAIEWMDEFHLSQLPVADKGKYLGIVNYDTLLNIDEDILLKNVFVLYADIFSAPHQHIFEILAIAEKYEIQVVPILDTDLHYLGFINVATAQKFVSFEMCNIKEHGAIIEILLENNNYSLVEISRLIEINNIKILNCFFTPSKKEGDTSNTLTIKLNTKDISRLLATLERYEYIIKNVYANENIHSLNKDRYDHLMKYLEI